jgi:hypothetical protein
MLNLHAVRLTKQGNSSGKDLLIAKSNTFSIDCRDPLLSTYGLPPWKTDFTSKIFFHCSLNYPCSKSSTIVERKEACEKTILDWDILGLSNIKEMRHHEILGSTCHPVLRKIMIDGIENGGILIPLFEDDVLVNCSVRKINSSKSLKYSLACPDVPVWGLDRFGKGQEIWITEGIFDMMAIFNLGKKSASCSSGMWSGLQLYQVVDKEPSSIVIFADNDSVGLRTSAILKEFFIMNQIPVRIVISKIAKDPAEHYFQKNQTLDNLLEIDVTLDMIEQHKDDVFNFLRHMKNRKY